MKHHAIFMKGCSLPLSAGVDVRLLIAGLGDHQAGTKQHRHLPGRQNEPPSAHRLPEEEEAAGAKKRSQFEN